MSIMIIRHWSCVVESVDMGKVVLQGCVRLRYSCLPDQSYDCMVIQIMDWPCKHFIFSDQWIETRKT